MDDLTDERLLRRAIGLSRLAKNCGNGPFGALLARGGSVLLEAENTVNEPPGDPTCHAEMNLLRQAVREFSPDQLAACVLYASTEPCPMCAGAMAFAGVGRLVFGASAERYVEQTGRGSVLPCRTILAAQIGRTFEVRGPLLEDEAVAAFL